MALIHAPVCSMCGKRKTRNASGICSQCRRLPPPSVPCRICGDIRTNHESGLCSRCRKVGADGERLKAAIEYWEETMLILRLRDKGLSFSQIAEVTGGSKSRAFERYRKALLLPNWAVSPD